MGFGAATWRAKALKNCPSVAAIMAPPITHSQSVSGKRLSRRSWGWWFGTLSCPLWRHYYDADGHLHIQHWWVRGPQNAPQNPTVKESCGVPFVQDWSKSLYLCCMQSAIWHSLSTHIITQSNVTCHACTALTNLSFFRKSFLTWLYLILHWRPITLYCHYSYDRDISRVECITIWMTCYAPSFTYFCFWSYATKMVINSRRQFSTDLESSALLVFSCINMGMYGYVHMCMEVYMCACENECVHIYVYPYVSLYAYAYIFMHDMDNALHKELYIVNLLAVRHTFSISIGVGPEL